jgi:hypothetical protein
VRGDLRMVRLLSNWDRIISGVCNDLFAVEKLVGYMGGDGLDNVSDDIWKALIKPF